MKLYILKILRQREGLEEDDTSKDDLFNKRDSIDNLREMVAWEIGSPGYANMVLTWAEDLGMDIKGKSKRR